MDDTVPGVASIVDNDVDLAVAKLGGLLDEVVNVVLVEDVASDSDGLAAVPVDPISDVGAFLYRCVSALPSFR